MKNCLLFMFLFGSLLYAEEITPENISKIHQEAANINKDQVAEVVADSQKEIQPTIETVQDNEAKAVENETSEVITGRTLRRLKIRIRPSFEHEVVGIFERDAEVEIVSTKIKDWYEIRLPEKSQVWIYKGDIGPNGKIIVDKCVMRSGSGVIFNPYKQTLQKDEAVTVLNEENNWIQIIPPDNRLTAWVSAQYVQLDKPELVTPPQESENKDENQVTTNEESQEVVAEQSETIEKVENQDNKAETDEQAENIQQATEKVPEVEAEPSNEAVVTEPTPESKITEKEEPVVEPEAEEPIQPIIEKNPYAFTPTDLPIKSIQGNTGRHVWCGYVYRMSRAPKGATHQLVVHLANGKKARVGYLCSDHAHIFLSDWQGWPVIVYGRLIDENGTQVLHVNGIQIDYRKLK